MLLVLLNSIISAQDIKEIVRKADDSIERMIKIPPSMMMQSWMGSDFTNDDLVRESSIVKDYTHKLLGEETIENYQCYKVELIPLENAPVVWGKVLMWVSKKDYLWLKAEFYDEDGILVSTEILSDLLIELTNKLSWKILIK